MPRRSPPVPAPLSLLSASSYENNYPCTKNVKFNLDGSQSHAVRDGLVE